MEPQILWDLLSWACLPPALLWLITLLSPYKLYVGRYFMCAVPGGVLLFAGILRGLRPLEARRILATALVAVLTILAFQPTHGGLNWREALQAARELSRESSCPVFIQSGLIEADQPDWLHDRERKSYLLAPTSFYPVDARAIPLPTNPNPLTNAYLDEISQQILASLDHFLVIENNLVPYRFLEERFQSNGFRIRTAGRFGSLSLMMFER